MKNTCTIVGGPPVQDENLIREGKEKGFTPLEYLEIRQDKRPNLYILPGFMNAETMHLRAEQLLANANNIGRIKAGENINNIEGFSLIIDENMVVHLDKNEKKRLIKTWYPVYVKQYSPRVFRYMDERFVNDFFDNGKLYLSSFLRFSKHENESLRDNAEGKMMLSVKVGKFKMETTVHQGHNSFVLCGTTMNTIEHAKKKFNQTSGFSIDDIDKFIKTIINAIHKTTEMQVVSVHHGPCMYLLEREHNVTILVPDDFSQEEFFNLMGIGSNGADYRRMGELDNFLAGEHGMFLKQSKHSDELEYRIIFSIEDHDIPDSIILEVPEAIKYCQRIEYPQH